MNPTRSSRVLKLVAGVVAAIVSAGGASNAGAEAARTGYSHAASALQSQLLDNYAKLAGGLDAMATRDPARIEAIIANGRPTLLAFLDRGCVECLRMIPVVGDLRKDFEPTVDVVVVDTDDKADGFRQLYRRFSVWTGPAFVVLDRDGKLLQRLLGPQPEASLRARLTALTESAPAVNQGRPASHSPAPTVPSPHRTSGTPRP